MRVAAVLALSLMAAPTGAADPATLLRDAQARVEAAASPDTALAALARSIEAHEASLATLRATLRALPEREAAALARVGAADGARLALLAALHRTVRAPLAMRVLHPAGTVAAARGAMLLGDLAADLTREQAALQAALADLAAVAAERRAAHETVAQALDGLAAAHADLAARLAARTRPAPREADRLLAKALGEAGSTLDDLAVLIDRLAADNAEFVAQRGRFDSARGTLPLPVLGSVTTDGTTLVITAEAHALVRAPWVSTVRHAGAVGLLGGVLVLEPAPGVLISLRGLGAMARQTAETVRVGEPLGHMGGALPATEEFLIAASSDAAVLPSRRLYIDVWRDGQAESAAAWFALEQ